MKKLMLVADDSLPVREFHHEMLDIMGYDVRIVESSEDAVLMLRGLPIYGAVLDNMMRPDFDGHEVLEHHRRGEIKKKNILHYLNF